MSRLVGILLGIVALVAIDGLVIGLLRLLDPGAPVIYMSNLAAVFIGGIQLLFGVPLILGLRRRRPGMATGVALGMVLVLALNAFALYH
jgi:hypothetical protein